MSSGKRWISETLKFKNFLGEHARSPLDWGTFGAPNFLPVRTSLKSHATPLNGHLSVPRGSHLMEVQLCSDATVSSDQSSWGKSSVIAHRLIGFIHGKRRCKSLLSCPQLIHWIIHYRPVSNIYNKYNDNISLIWLRWRCLHINTQPDDKSFTLVYTHSLILVI